MGQIVHEIDGDVIEAGSRAGVDGFLGLDGGVGSTDMFEGRIIEGLDAEGDTVDAEGAIGLHSL